MKTVYIMRGVSGSGKSTKANELHDENSIIVSADHYFNIGGEYKFDFALLPKAHTSCKEIFVHALKQKIQKIIVDNTNTQFWEAQFYVFTALAHDYSVVIVEPSTDWAFNVDELVKRNVHGVPRESIEKMIQRYEGPMVFLGKIKDVIGRIS